MIPLFKPASSGRRCGRRNNPGVQEPSQSPSKPPESGGQPDRLLKTGLHSVGRSSRVRRQGPDCGLDFPGEFPDRVDGANMAAGAGGA